MTGYSGVLQEVRAVSGSAVLVAVSKTHPYEAVMEAYAEGARIFGENRVQEAEAKFLNIKKGSPINLCTNICFSQETNTPVVYEILKYRGDKNKYSIEINID